MCRVVYGKGIGSKSYLPNDKMALLVNMMEERTVSSNREGVFFQIRQEVISNGSLLSLERLSVCQRVGITDLLPSNVCRKRFFFTTFNFFIYFFVF